MAFRPKLGPSSREAMPQLKRPAASGKAAASAVPAPKKQRVEAKQLPSPPLPKPSGPLLEVAKGLELAATLPESAKGMLIDMLETSLGVLKEQRHRHQVEVVRIIGEALASEESDLQAQVEEIKAKISNCETTKASLATKCSEREGELEARARTTLEKKRALADAAREYRCAVEAAAVAEAQEGDADRQAQKAIKNKELLEGALSESVRPLTEGVVEAAAVQEKVDNLMQLLGKFDLEKSIIAALPTALLKVPSSRGSFDTMVLTQLEEEVAKRVAALEVAIKDAEPTKAAHIEAFSEAQRSLAEAKQKQLDAATAYTGAHEEEKLQEGELYGTRQSLQQVHKEATKLHRELRKAEAALEAFGSGPHSAYHQLVEAGEQAVEAAAEPATTEATAA